MSPPILRHSIAPALPILATIATLLLLSCARPEARPEPVKARPIDLRPRCAAERPAVVSPERAAPTAVDTGGTSDPALRETALHDDVPHEEVLDGLRLFVKPAPRSGLAMLSWGFRLPTEASNPDAAPRLAAALLRAGETTVRPEAFRRALLEIGATTDAFVEGGWLWLEMRFPEPRSARAFVSLAQWVDPAIARPRAFERIQREVALARLAEDASPTRLAERTFRKVHPPPAGALDPDATAPDDSGATPEGILSFLESVFRIDGSVVLYTGREESGRVRALLEDTLARAWPPTEIQPTSAGSRPSREAEPSEPHEEPWTHEGSSEGAWPSRVPASRRSEARPPPHDTKSDFGIRTEEASILVVDRPGSAQVEILVGFPAPPPQAPEFGDLELWSSLLGGGVGGRLFRDLRERQGLAYIIVAEQSAEGRFVVSTRSRPERVVALLRGIEAHLRALVDTRLEDCEVRMLQRRRSGEQTLLAEDPSAWMARSRVDVEVTGRPRSLGTSDRRAVEALRTDLDVVADAVLGGVPTIVVVGDADALRRDLTDAYPDRPVREFDPSAEPR